MNPVKRLTGIYRKNFEMPMPEEGVKMNVYTSLGIIAVVCIMLPCCLIMGYLSYVMTMAMMVEGNRVNGLISEMHILSAFAMVLGMPVVFNVLFFSSDREHMVTLPIKSHHLLAAKFFHTFFAESVMEFLIFISIFIGFFTAAVSSMGPWPSLHPVSIIAALTGIVLTPMLPLVYCCIISLILMAVLKKVRSIKTFYRSSTVLMFIFIALFIYSFKDMGTISFDNYMDSLAADNNFFIRFCNAFFFTTPLLCKAMAFQDIPGLLLYYLGNAASVGVILLLGALLYQSGLYTAAALGSRKKKADRDKLSLGSTNIFTSYFMKEVRMLTRTRAYASNCVYINFIWPIGIAIFFIITRSNESILEFMKYYKEGYDRALLIVLLAVIFISFVASAMNSLSSTAFTREGSHVDIIKYLPVDYKTQMYVKASVALALTAPFLILSVAAASFFLGFSFLTGLYYSMIALEALVISVIIGLALDSASPYTLWDDEYSALRGNLNSFFNMAVMIVMSLLICGLFFLLYELVHIPLTAVYIALPVFLGIINAAAVIYGRRRIIANMKELY
ncbi:MAG: hypothetical protein J6X66_08015 [Lachnospiraceae bacterium]|nr:hypothetical protein [Lachnospiraceae bacterium]